MAQYTEEDKAAFARKDRMIVAQTSLERSIETVLSLGSHGLEKFTLQAIKQRVFETAEEYYDWVFNKADGEGNVNNGSVRNTTDSIVPVLPTPTKQQLEWLGKIESKYGFTKEDIWKKCNMYPGNKDEAVVVTKLMKG